MMLCIQVPLLPQELCAICLQVHPGCPRFTSLRLNRKGTLLLAASLDKYVRMFEVAAQAAADGGFTAQEAQQRVQALPKVRRACRNRFDRQYATSDVSGYCCKSGASAGHLCS